MKFKRKQHKSIILLVLKIVKNYYKNGIKYGISYIHPDNYVVVYHSNIKVKEYKGNYLIYIDLKELMAYSEGRGYLRGYEIVCDKDFRERGFENEYPLLSIEFKGNKIYFCGFTMSGKKKNIYVLNTNNIYELFDISGLIKKQRLYVELT